MLASGRAVTPWTSSSESCAELQPVFAVTLTRTYRVEAADGKFYDREGVEVRECPECGHNMYQQGRTWTCENCGYSYIE